MNDYSPVDKPQPPLPPLPAAVTAGLEKLSKLDATSDLEKPVSTQQKAAIDGAISDALEGDGTNDGPVVRLDPATDTILPELMPVYDAAETAAYLATVFKSFAGYDPAVKQVLSQENGNFAFVSFPSGDNSGPTTIALSSPTLSDGGFAEDVANKRFTSGANGGTMIFGDKVIPAGRTGRIRMLVQDYANPDGNHSGSKGTPRLMLLTRQQAQALIAIVGGDVRATGPNFVYTEIFSNEIGQVKLGDQTVSSDALFNFKDAGDLAINGTLIEIRVMTDKLAFGVITPDGVDVAPGLDNWRNVTRYDGDLVPAIMTGFAGYTVYAPQLILNAA